MNIIAPPGLSFCVVLVTGSLNPAYCIFIPLGFNTSPDGLIESPEGLTHSPEGTTI